MKEEIGVEPTEWSYLDTIIAKTSDAVVKCRFYVVTAWRGEPTNLQLEEHEVIEWFSIESAQSLQLADPAYPTLFTLALEKG